MTVKPIIARNRPGHFVEGGAYWITRLNNLLELQNADLRTLNNGAFENLIDKIYFAMFGEERNRDPRILFNQIAIRPNVIETQEGLRKLLHTDVDESDPKVEIEVEKQTLTIGLDEAGYFRG